MARIVFAPYGSLGDLHPFLALALEMRERGHDVVICTLEVYREKIDVLGFEFFSLRPDVDIEDRELAREMMNSRSGTERIVKDLMLGNIRQMFEDLMVATENADVLIAGEIVFASHSVAETRNIKQITTSLAPLSMFSVNTPNIYPNAMFLKHLNFLGKPFHQIVLTVMRKVLKGWLKSYREFRREIGLSESHNPILDDKFSNLLHLAMFSEGFAKPQEDWNSATAQTGFCFYDGQKDLGQMPDGLEEFLDAGEPPIVFTLGSAAVMDARDFFEQSIESARMLKRRAIMLYGVFNKPPKSLDEDRVAFDYAPYSKIFPRAACVVHQAGVGTTAQLLRAGVPHLIMPFSHDQPDNAARCERLGVGKTISRDEYNAENAARQLRKLLENVDFKAKAGEIKRIIDSEDGTRTACDAIEKVLNKQ